MFNLGWPELLLIGIVLLLVVGPERLPQTLRQIRAAFETVREMGREARDGLTLLMEDEDLRMVRQQVEDSLAADDFRQDLITPAPPKTPPAEAEDEKPS